MNSLHSARVASHGTAGCSRRCLGARSTPTAAPGSRRSRLTLLADAKHSYESYLRRAAVLAAPAWQTEGLHSGLVVEQDAVRSWYDALSAGPGALDSLDDIVAPTCTMYSSIDELDTYRLPAVKRELSRLQATHPLLRYEVDDVIADPKRRVAVAHYRAICADLLPHADGSPATGQLSEVVGRDEFCFDDEGKIRSIASFRERFIDETYEEGEVETSA